MQHLQEKEVLASWKRCLEKGVSHTNILPTIRLNYTDFDIIREKNSMIISVFEDSIKAIETFLPMGYYFLLVNPSGIVLKKKEISLKRKNCLKLMKAYHLQRKAAEPVQFQCQ
jgi:transcriptional regulator of acetoin/glycerol metabolism